MKSLNFGTLGSGFDVVEERPVVVVDLEVELLLEIDVLGVLELDEVEDSSSALINSGSMVSRHSAEAAFPSMTTAKALLFVKQYDSTPGTSTLPCPSTLILTG